MNTVHKITNGEGEVKGWAVVANGSVLVGEFKSIEDACAAAEAGASDNTLAAIKTLKNYSASAVQVVIADTGFATEVEAALALWRNNWDIGAAVNALLFS